MHTIIYTAQAICSIDYVIFVMRMCSVTITFHQREACGDLLSELVVIHTKIP